MIIYIDVTRDNIEIPKPDDPDDTETLLKGTFKEPYTLVKVKEGTPVEWRIRGNENAHDKDVFVVGFGMPDGSPFVDGNENPIKIISGGTGPLEARVRGSFHYTVVVVDGGT